MYPKATFWRYDRYDSNERLLLTRKGNSGSVPLSGSTDLHRLTGAGDAVIRSHVLAEDRLPNGSEWIVENERSEEGPGRKDWLKATLIDKGEPSKYWEIRALTACSKCSGLSRSERN